MSDLIKREDAVEAVYEALRTPLPDYRNDFFHDSMSYAIKIVNNIPSAEPEQEKGKWTKTDIYDEQYGYLYECPYCKKLEWGGNFCPNCGADMRGENE